MDDPQQMTDKRVEPASRLVPYRRGVSLREVVKGTLALFLPGSLLTLIGGMVLFAIGAGNARRFAAIVLWQTVSLGGLVIALTAGFGLGLLGLRRWLYPDAKLDGSRSFVAGLLSPVVVFIVMVSGEWSWTFAQVVSVVALVGVVMAVAMFFAWLTPTPKELRRH